MNTENNNIMIELDNAICKNHTGKMMGLASLSSSCKNNKFCEKMHKTPGTICERCFAQAQFNRYKSMQNKYKHNTDILTTVELQPEDIPYINYQYFRFEAFGELNNVLQARNYIEIAKKNSHVNFALWTKRPNLIKLALKKYNLDKPDNIQIIYSEPLINKKTTATAKKRLLSLYPFIDHVFTVYDKNTATSENIAINCGSKNCIDCLNCYKPGGSFEVNELLK